MLNNLSYGWTIIFLYITAQFSFFQVQESLWVTKYIISRLSINLKCFASPQRRVMVPLSGHQGFTQKFGIALSWDKAFQPLLTAISLCWRPVEPSTERSVLKESGERQSAWPASRKQSPAFLAGTQSGVCGLGLSQTCLHLNPGSFP